MCIFVPEKKLTSSWHTGGKCICLIEIKQMIMLKEQAGELAGLLWNTLNGTEEMPLKQLKKLTKLTDKNLYLGLGWLLREDKVVVEEMDGELFAKLA